MTPEPTTGDVPALAWRKSSYSTNDGPECVEVASVPGVVHVRDSKDPHGPRFAFPAPEWAAFVAFAAR
jgi:hypothetical protein